MCWRWTSAPGVPRWPGIDQPAHRGPCRRAGAAPPPPPVEGPNKIRTTGGRPSPPPPVGPWRRRTSPSGSSGWAAPLSGPAPSPSGPTATPLMPAMIWMDSRGNQAIRKAAGGVVNVLGYAPARSLRWLWLTGGAPGVRQDPVAHILFIRDIPRRLPTHRHLLGAGRLPEPEAHGPTVPRSTLLPPTG